MVDFKGYFLTMAATFVLNCCVHDLNALSVDSFLQNNKAVFFSGEAVPRYFGITGKYRR